MNIVIDSNVLFGRSHIGNYLSRKVLHSYIGGFRNMVDVSIVSTKGQVVIPSHIREELGLEEGTQMVVSKMDDFVLLKKVHIPDPKEEFKKLTEIGSKHAKKLGVRSEEDVVRMIHEGRKKKA